MTDTGLPMCTFSWDEKYERSVTKKKCTDNLIVGDHWCADYEAHVCAHECTCGATHAKDEEVE